MDHGGVHENRNIVLSDHPSVRANLARKEPNDGAAVKSAASAADIGMTH